VEITDENLKNLKTLCSKIVDKLKDIDDNELKNVTGGGDFLDVAHHLTSRTNNSNAITGALVGLGLSIFYNYKDKKSFGKKAANVAMSTLAGAIIGYGSGTGQEAIQKKWFENSSFIIMSNYYNNE
ncbi:MAG: hypothetical protein LBJ32_01670, partial [Oscillospiraceae bacterium]|nr:hypothetical protein [Oscillospiraceae bacterium]